MRSIILNQEMVKAYAEGRKDVSRVPMKVQPDTSYWKPEVLNTPKEWRKQICLGPGHHADPDMWCLFNVGDKADAVPYFGIKAPLTPGERIYIRETFEQEKYGGLWAAFDHAECKVTYMADGVVRYFMLHGEDKEKFNEKKVPSIHMPEWAARFRPTVISIRPERIQDITHIEAIREGVMAYPLSSYMEGGVRPDQTAADVYFRELWDRLYPGSWERNELVWRREITKPEGV